MTTVKHRSRWVMGGGATVLLIVLLPLWGEFSEPGNIGWNVFLTILLVALAVGAFVLQRHLEANVDEIGEARFNADGSKKIDG